ncbi:hypothetical protein QBZ16_002861 [Prototheca wickerhamii]|uniref:CNH domain-containing protein n=1 Tax=Prototheca wickerhamii TaxID=3111 RepID=A0AAD9ML53_PROWI|nr:hypothetical protein QBZ16_002861 [Prototheca wickerhamii]
MNLCLGNGDLVTLPPELPPPGEAASTGGPPSPERTIRTKRNLTEGPVLQLHADSSRSMLLALGRSGVRAFRLPQLLLRAEAPGTNGCDRFAWHERSGTLVASYRRKLYVYAYEGLEFVRRRDVTLPDRVACLAFSGALLCVGTAREYLAVDLATGAQCALCAHAHPAPCVAVDGRRHGAPGRGGVLSTLRWSGTPAALAVSEPYALSRGLVAGRADGRQPPGAAPPALLVWDERGSVLRLSQRPPLDQARAAGAGRESLKHFGASRAAGTRALLSLLPSLASGRLLAALPGGGAGPGLGPDVAVGPEPRGEEFIRAVSQPAQPRGPRAAESPGAEPTPTAVAIDTAILRALLVLPDHGALLGFVRRPNVADLDEGRAALLAAGRYSELVALLQARGRHGDALDLLETLSQRPGALPVPPTGASSELRGLPGVWAATGCLLRLGREQLPLLAQHLPWVLAADPDSTLQQLVVAEGLRPEDVLPVLTAHSPRLAAAYLEETAALGRVDPDAFARPLAALYLQRIVEYAGSSEGRPDPEARQLAETGKLRALILRGAPIDLEGLLRLLPRDRLLELRAAVLERLGRHREALDLFVRRLGSLAAAEAYCDRVYARQLAREGEGGAHAPDGPRRALASADAESISPAHLPALRLWLDRTGARGPARSRPSDIYLLLIQVLLEEREAEGAQDQASLARWADVAALLSRKREAIEPLHALELLPSELPLHQARQFLHSAIWGVQEERRSVAVRKALRRAELAALELRLAHVKNRSISMTAERVCPICYKRIGQGAAFVAFPSGGVAHYSCYASAGGEGRASGAPAAAPIEV